LGSISGQLLGTYDEAGNSWQTVGAGTFMQTKPVSFSSEIEGHSYYMAHEKGGSSPPSLSDGTWITKSYSYLDRVIDGSVWPYGFQETHVMTTESTRVTFDRYEIVGAPGHEIPYHYVWVNDYGADKNWGTPDDTYTFKVEKAYVKSNGTADYDAFYADLRALEGDDSVSGVHYENYYLEDSDFSGIFAGVGNLWANIAAGKATHVYILADTNLMDTGTSFNLFSGELASFDPLKTLNPYTNSTTPIGGAYDGFLGGVVNATTKDVGVLFRAFYLDPDGNFGLLYPDNPITGTANLEVGMWKAEGDIAGYQLRAVTGLASQNFVSTLGREENYTPLTEGLTGTDVVGADSATSTITLDVIKSTNITLPPPLNNTYQLGLNVIGGTYSGTPLSWMWQIDTPTPNPTDTSWIVTNITTPVNNVFTGTVVEAHVNWADARTYVTGGEVKGLFNPTTSTWKAVGINFQMETGEFMNQLASLTTDAQKEAFYKATKIPCVEIGRTNLTGTGSGTGWSINMSGANGMRDVVFLAPTSGARPRSGRRVR